MIGSESFFEKEQIIYIVKYSMEIWCQEAVRDKHWNMMSRGWKGQNIRICIALDFNQTSPSCNYYFQLSHRNKFYLAIQFLRELFMIRFLLSLKVHYIHFICNKIQYQDQLLFLEARSREFLKILYSQIILWKFAQINN